MYGQEDSIELYEEDVLEEIIGVAEDFELLRFSHKPYDNDTKTDVKYDFHFYSGNPTNVTTATNNDWVTSYLPEGFTKTEVYYFEKPFTKSFFKLDFYDTMDGKSQTNYFTIIIPSYSGSYEKIDITANLKNVLVKRPNYNFDYITSPGEISTNMDGFFYYWLKSRKFIDLDTFYMSVKFFDAKLGVFVRMMTVPQSTLADKFVFNNGNYFYNKVVLDYATKTYRIYNYLDSRIGTGSPIKWYEYVNP